MHKPGTKTTRSYTRQTLKLLWGRAAGRCAVPECRMNLIAEETDYDPAVPIGEVAHAEAVSSDGPRANPALTQRQKNEYDNLILLCRNCHARLDNQPRYHSIDYIRQLKLDHEAWVKASLPERGRSSTGWRVILLAGEQPVDSGTVEEALTPDYVSGERLEIKAAASACWPKATREMRSAVADLFAGQDSYDARFAVFPVAPVSACVCLGYLLTSRPTVRMFQYHRDEQTWRWPDADGLRPGVSIRTIQDVGAPSSIAFLFELSARIDHVRITSRLPADTRILSLAVPRPRSTWLRDPRQLQTLGAMARGVFEECLCRWPRAKTWHLFYAGPAPGAVVVGQQLSPTMMPPVQLYEYVRPNHTESLVLAPTVGTERPA